MKRRSGIYRLLRYIWARHWVQSNSLRYIIIGGMNDEPVGVKIEFTIMPDRDDFEQFAKDLAEHGIWLHPRESLDSNKTKRRHP